jgi:hypothetical protein
MNTNQKVTTNKLKLSASAIKTIGYTALLTMSLTLGMHYAQATPLQSNKVYGFQKGQSQSDYEQIDAALAPIALYPDSLLTHILIASTYPLEVIEAARFIQQHPKFDLDDYEKNGLGQDTIEVIQEDALEYGWDASVIALTAFPDILNNMSDDLAWLSDLGDAFKNNQELVLSRVQKLRELAYDQGNLQNDEQVEVVVEREQNTRVIVIQPRRHELVYVPYYDTTIIYGPSWHVTSSYRWSRPYYARHYRHNYVYFTPAAYIGSRLLFGGIHWGNRHISINRDWSYRQARHYNYTNTRYKRVHHKEYQPWKPEKRHTRHGERQKYAGNKETHSAYKRNAWVTNKHSEFADVRSSNKKITRNSAYQSKRQFSKQISNDEQRPKLSKKIDKAEMRQAKPIRKGEIERNDRVVRNKTDRTKNSKSQRQLPQLNRNVSQPNRESYKQRRQVTHGQESKPQRQVMQRQESKPQRQVTQRQESKPQRQMTQRQESKAQRHVSKSQREVSKPQRQHIQRTKVVKRSKE